MPISCLNERDGMVIKKGCVDIKWNNKREFVVITITQKILIGLCCCKNLLLQYGSKVDVCKWTGILGRGINLVTAKLSASGDNFF